MTASVVGSDTTSGLALLEADSDDLPAATLARTAPASATTVVALSGDPHSHERGGERHRRGGQLVRRHDGERVRHHGASRRSTTPGAPVIDNRAQVAGILLPRTGSARCPSTTRGDIANSIRNSGSVEHAWIGVVGRGLAVRRARDPPRDQRRARLSRGDAERRRGDERERPNGEHGRRAARRRPRPVAQTDAEIRGEPRRYVAAARRDGRGAADAARTTDRAPARPR